MFNKCIVDPLHTHTSCCHVDFGDPFDEDPDLVVNAQDECTSAGPSDPTRSQTPS
jgi:hypothetical protein